MENTNRKVVDNRDLGNLDLNIKRYTLLEHLIMINTLLITVYSIYCIYVNTPFISFRVTLGSIAQVITIIAGSLYVLGVYVDIEPKIYHRLIFFPLAIMPVDVLILVIFSVFIKNMSIQFSSFIILFLWHIIHSFLLYNNFKRINVTYLELTDAEAYDILHREG